MTQLTSAQPDTFASASSSSCSASTSSASYEVFINHRGPDVKKTFAGLLYRELKKEGLQVFLDKPELEPGHNNSSQIEAAIQGACVHIAIFSPNYAGSPWCLDELVRMLDSKGTILPVFYNVKPSDLSRTHIGAYAKAFQEHEKKQRYDLQRIGEWKTALSHVAAITGFELEASDGDMVVLLDKVVEQVLKTVPKPKAPITPLYVAKDKIGLEEKLEGFEREVLSQPEEEGRLEAKVVGIVGSGGIGKSTLAREFFNSKRSKYDVSSFLIDVRENAATKSLNSLQRQLIQDLKGEDIEIKSWEEGIGILEQKLKSSHALIILDDVDHRDQLNAFLPIKHVLDPNSLILVTSRNKKVLLSEKIAESSIYHLKGLNRPQSLELFCRHAFFQHHPLPGFEVLANRFVKACDGLPLSLQVFGGLLCQENEKIFWEERLNGLQNLPRDIQERLKISYDSLETEEKDIFLDIACFSIGEYKDKWISIWKESGWKGSVGLRNLENKCLVEVDSQNRIRMHDHLRDMGRNIAQEKSMPRRLWSATINHIYDLLEQSLASDIEVRGIIMPHQDMSGGDTWKEGIFSDKEFRITKLQLLEAEGDIVSGILRKVRLPNLNLIWLQCYGCLSLPSWISMRDLRFLTVSDNNLKRLWQRESQMPSNSLRDRLQRKYLHLNCCRKLINSNETLGNITTVQCLQLKHLHLSRCPNLIISNETLGNITTLECLDLSNHPQMEILPQQVFHQRSLRRLDLLGTNIKEFPSAPKEFLNNLEILTLGSRLLKVLPQWLGDLTSLKQLELIGCPLLNCLPDSVGHLNQLTLLYISECGIQYLPPDVMKMNNLETLRVFNCPLRALPFKKVEGQGATSLLTESSIHIGMTQLKHMYLTCTKISEVSFPEGVCPNLEKLQISQCNDLVEVGALPTTLLLLVLGDCPSLRKIGGLSGLAKLQHLEVWGCSALHVKEMPGYETGKVPFKEVYTSSPYKSRCYCLDDSHDYYFWDSEPNRCVIM